VSEETRYPEVLVDVPLDEADAVSAVLFDLGASGVEQRDEGTLAKGAVAGAAMLVASFEDRATAEAAVSELDPAWTPRFSEVVGDAWRDEWKKHFAPFRLTDRVTIRPPWQTYEARDGSEVVLELEPGRAFGTGLHASTALVAKVLEGLGPRLVGGRVLDVGAGSGILALVAIALGAARACAVDHDPEAVAVTLENARRNGYETRIDASTVPIGALHETYDVVVANIEARVLVDLAPDLTVLTRPKGVLVLSGVLAVQEEEVVRAFPGFDLKDAPRREEWIALVLERQESRPKV
jgi:ribosomal protein L11 methyltransferase